MYQHLLFVGVLLSVAIVPYVLKRVPRSAHKSLSQHIAQDPKVIRFAQVVFSIEAMLVVLWYFGWYMQAHATFPLQAMLLVAVCVLAALSGLVPFHEGRRAGDVHNFVAWSYTYLLPLLAVTFMFTADTQAAKIIIALGVVWQLYSIALLWLKPAAKKYFLYYQLSYIAVFAVALLVATYIG